MVKCLIEEDDPNVNKIHVKTFVNINADNANVKRKNDQ